MCICVRICVCVVSVLKCINQLLFETVQTKTNKNKPRERNSEQNSLTKSQRDNTGNLSGDYKTNLTFR